MSPVYLRALEKLAAYPEKYEPGMQLRQRLRKLGLIEEVALGRWRLTKEGREALAS